MKNKAHQKGDVIQDVKYWSWDLDKEEQRKGGGDPADFYISVHHHLMNG